MLKKFHFSRRIILTVFLIAVPSVFSAGVFGYDQVADRFAAVSPQEIGYFKGNLYLNNVYLGNFSKTQAKSYFSKLEEKRVSDFLLAVRVNDQKYDITARNINWSSNTEQLLDELWEIGRSNSSTGGKSYYSTYTYDSKKLDFQVDEVAKHWEVETGSSDIEGFDLENREFIFKTEKIVTFDKAELKSKLEAAIASISSSSLIREAEVYVSAGEKPIPVDVEELSSHYGLLGTCTTYTTNAPNRNTNIKVAGETINGLCLEAEDVFSFNNSIGPTTTAKGYKVAGILINGKASQGMGGGICQLSSTLYNAVLEAGLTVVERHPHSAAVPYLPVGKDATVNYGTADFRFQNSLDEKIYIVVDFDNSALTVSLYGKKA